MIRFLATLALVLAATPAAAHTGVGGIASLRDGLLHPMGGLDHVLAMVAVGIWAGMVGGRALWAWPAAFLAFMMLGGVLGFAYLALPAVELVIALSVVVLGAAIAAGFRTSVASGTAVCAAFALFHGYAHGAEMSAEAGIIGYAAGFLAATALLHGLGIGAALVVAQQAPGMTRLAGGGVAVAGAVLLVGAV